jgi:Na+/H+-dicarboxylate symporter
VFYPLLAKLFTRIPAKRFLKEMYPAQLIAFTTSSSSATLPVTMDVAQNRLGINHKTCSFVLPIGATVNMDGTSCFQTISIIFITQVLGLDLSLGQLLTIIFMTIISSIGTPGIPGGSYVVMTMILSSIGVPAQGLALILGIDRPLDMIRTAVNVTGDVLVSAMVEPKEDRN